MRMLAIVGLTAGAVAIGAAAAPLYFPSTDAAWERVTPEEAAWKPAAISDALQFAASRQSTGVVILAGGRILAEEYWNGDAPIEDVASVQKSVVGLLAGMAEERRQLNLDAPVDRYLGAGWSKAERAAEERITVRHLMTMTSGLNDALVYQRPAGAVWRYNTGAYSRMIPILEKATGTDISTLTERWLTGPIGMTSSRWVTRPWAAGNDAANAIGFRTTARDLARFGLLILNGAKWQDQDLLENRAYFERMLTPSQSLNRSYGLLWWLNGQRGMVAGGAQHESLIPSAPRDLVAALGAQGRKVYVVPSLQLVVTRLGTNPGDSFDEEFWSRLMKGR